MLGLARHNLGVAPWGLGRSRKRFGNARFAAGGSWCLRSRCWRQGLYPRYGYLDRVPEHRRRALETSSRQTRPLPALRPWLSRDYSHRLQPLDWVLSWTAVVVTDLRSSASALISESGTVHCLMRESWRCFNGHLISSMPRNEQVPRVSTSLIFGKFIFLSTVLSSSALLALPLGEIAASRITSYFVIVDRT